MLISHQNLFHAQELQKHTYDKSVKYRSYVSDKKVFFNNKYIKIKQNQKLEIKFFNTFRVLYSVGKQAYKLELPTK